MEPIDFGVCRLAIVPVRNAPADTAEQVTQMLFGDHYEVRAVSSDKRWIQIVILTDESGGWIDCGQHHSVTPEYLDQIRNSDFKITTDIATTILYKKSPLTIVLGSVVPISPTELFKMEEQLAFNGESKSLSQRRDFEFLRAIAVKYINSPYQWGGRSPFGIDAGGFCQMVFKIAGYPLPRHVGQQINQGKKIKSLVEAKPGDIAFFSDKAGTPTHAGIVLEDERIIHASGRVRIDHLNEEGILNAETKIYTHHVSVFRRVLTE